MAAPWFTNPDASGEVSLTWRDGTWYVESPSVDSEVKCLLTEDATVDPDDSPVQVTGTVLKYIRGSEDRPNFLQLQLDNVSAAEAGTTEANELESQPESDTSTSRQDLVDFTGSGDYVTVEAVIDSVYWVKKETSGVPDIKGELTDDSVRGSVTFVVNDGVAHPYLEEGERFEFRGVKDHYYSKEAEVQVMVTDHTDFTSRERADHSTSSTSTTDSSTKRTSSRRNHSVSNKNLNEIAEDQIGDEEFTITQDDRESAIEEAKKRAKKQQRDPAIDPKLQEDRDGE